MQRGVKRAVLHLQEFIRSPLNVLTDLVTVSRSIEKRPQDEHVKRSLEEPDPLLPLFHHRRHSTLDLAAIVDIRLPIVNGESFPMQDEPEGGLFPTQDEPEGIRHAEDG
jgi:hypothetical protein